MIEPGEAWFGRQPADVLGGLIGRCAGSRGTESEGGVGLVGSVFGFADHPHGRRRCKTCHYAAMGRIWKGGTYRERTPKAQASISASIADVFSEAR